MKASRKQRGAGALPTHADEQRSIDELYSQCTAAYQIIRKKLFTDLRRADNADASSATNTGRSSRRIHRAVNLTSTAERTNFHTHFRKLGLKMGELTHERMQHYYWSLLSGFRKIDGRGAIEMRYKRVLEQAMNAAFGSQQSGASAMQRGLAYAAVRYEIERFRRKTLASSFTTSSPSQRDAELVADSDKLAQLIANADGDRIANEGRLESSVRAAHANTRKGGGRSKNGVYRGESVAKVRERKSAKKKTPRGRQTRSGRKTGKQLTTRQRCELSVRAKSAKMANFIKTSAKKTLSKRQRKKIRDAVVRTSNCKKRLASKKILASNKSLTTKATVKPLLAMTTRSMTKQKK